MTNGAPARPTGVATRRRPWRAHACTCWNDRQACRRGNPASTTPWIAGASAVGYSGETLGSNRTEHHANCCVSVLRGGMAAFRSRARRHRGIDRSRARGNGSAMRNGRRSEHLASQRHRCRATLPNWTGNAISCANCRIGSVPLTCRGNSGQCRSLRGAPG